MLSDEQLRQAKEDAENGWDALGWCETADVLRELLAARRFIRLAKEHVIEVSCAGEDEYNEALDHYDEQTKGGGDGGE